MHKCSKNPGATSDMKEVSYRVAVNISGATVPNLCTPGGVCVGDAVHQHFNCGLPSRVIPGCELRAAQMMLQMFGYRNGHVVVFGNPFGAGIIFF